MSDKNWTGACSLCKTTFAIEIFHNGFGDTSYAYCDTCGITSILSGWNKKWPKGVKLTQAEIVAEMEPYLKPCDCGGKFTKGNSPRCPMCKHPLSAEEATEYFERQAPGTKKGWRWQRNWSGIYCAVVEGKRVVDNFKEAT